MIERRISLSLWTIFAACAACSDPTGPGTGGGVDMTGGGGGGGPVYKVETVDDTASGEGTATVIAGDGSAHVLYFNVGDANCTPMGGGAMGLSYRNATLKHALRTGPETFTRANVSAPNEPVATNGLSALWDQKAGQVVVSYQGGTKGAFYCAGTDMMLARFGGAWTRATVAASSTAGANAPEQAGDVVGVFSALAQDAAGALYLAWQDTHFGGFQQDDTRKADVELAIGAGTPKATGEIIAAAGAGMYNSLAVDAAGQVLLAYSGYVTGGVTVAVRKAQGQWQFTQAVQSIPVQPALAVAPKSGKIGLAYFDTNLRLLRFSESTDGGKNFPSDLVDRDGDTGRYVALRYDAQDRPVLAYYKCGDYRPNQGCDPTKDGLRVARRLDDGTWQIADVDGGGDGACGTYPSLALTSGGKAVVAYQCNLFRAATGQFQPAVRMALEQ